MADPSHVVLNSSDAPPRDLERADSSMLLSQHPPSDAQPPELAHRTADPHAHPAYAADGVAAGSGKSPDDPAPGWPTRLLRWVKHTHLYEVTSTGHEDACAFECSRVSDRRGHYWPPLYKDEDLKKSCWLRVKRFWVSTHHEQHTVAQCHATANQHARRGQRMRMRRCCT